MASSLFPSTVACTRRILALLSLATPVLAGTFNVTTTADGLGVPGLSLREAFASANADGEASTIHLVAGSTYTLTVCGSNENANATGDLDHTDAHPLTIQGNGATIQQSCAGDRIVHNLAATTVVLHEITVTGGVVGLTEYGGGIWMDSGDLELHDCSIVDNSAGESGGGVQMDTGSLTIVSSLFDGNHSGLPGGALEISASAASLTIADSIFSNNDGDIGGAIAAGRAIAVSITNCAFTGNAASDGAALYLGQIDSGLIADSSFELNDGATAITYRDTRPPSGAAPSIIFERCTVAANNVAGGAAISVETDNRVLLLRNTTVSGNAGIGVHALDEGIINLQHATVVRNTGANIHAIGLTELYTTASIIAEAEGAGAHDCELSIGADSGGYNFVGDGTCGTGLGTGDVSFGGDPKLANLANNGGPTRTHAPYADSPLLDLVPPAVSIAVLGAAPTDQRGVSRPVGPANEIGAYEGHLLVNAGALALVIVADATKPHPADRVLLERLRNSGFTVRVHDDLPPLPPAPVLSDVGLVVLSPSVPAQQIDADWRHGKIPLVVFDPEVFAKLDLTTRAPRHSGWSKPQTHLVFEGSGHPLAAGFSGKVEVAAPASPFVYGRPLPSAEKIATLNCCPKQSGIFAYERGSRLAGSRAPARRVAFFAGLDALPNLTPAGETLLDAALQWAAQDDRKHIERVKETKSRLHETHR